MAKVFLATPKKDQDPQVTAWADDVIKVQEKEIAEMKELLSLSAASKNRPMRP